MSDGSARHGDDDPQYWRTPRKNHASQTVHTDPDCDGLSNANRIIPADPDALPHHQECPICILGEVPQANQSPPDRSFYDAARNANPEVLDS